MAASKQHSTAGSFVFEIARPRLDRVLTIRLYADFIRRTRSVSGESSTDISFSGPKRHHWPARKAWPGTGERN